MYQLLGCLKKLKSKRPLSRVQNKLFLKRVQQEGWSQRQFYIILITHALSLDKLSLNELEDLSLTPEITPSG